MSFKCNFCEAILSTKSNLIAHQKKTIKCLEIQYAGIKTKEDIRNEQQFGCDICAAKFFVKKDLDKHTKICNSKEITQKYKHLYGEFQKQRDQLIEQSIIIKSKDELIFKLELQLSEERKSQERITITAMTKPTTSVRNTIKNLQINNLTPLMEGEMREFLPQLTQEHIKDGAIGYARYALEYPLKGKFAVADASRKKLAWKNPEDPEGKIFYDNEGVELSKKFFRIIKERNFSLVREIMLEITVKKDDAVERGDQQECDACDDLMCKLDDYRRYVREASLEEVKENELRDSFVKCLCSLSTEASKKT